MIREEDGRAILHCDRCAVRMDLGNVVAHRAKTASGRPPRLPTGWAALDGNRHQCSLHPVAMLRR